MPRQSIRVCQTKGCYEVVPSGDYCGPHGPKPIVPDAGILAESKARLAKGEAMRAAKQAYIREADAVIKEGEAWHAKHADLARGRGV